MINASLIFGRLKVKWKSPEFNHLFNDSTVNTDCHKTFSLDQSDNQFQCCDYISHNATV